MQRVLLSVPWGFLKTWEHAIQQILLSKIPPDIKDCSAILKLRQLKNTKMKMKKIFDRPLPPNMGLEKGSMKKENKAIFLVGADTHPPLLKTKKFQF